MGKHRKEVQRSYLQKLWQETSFLIYFRIKPLSQLSTRHLKPSKESVALTAEINKLMGQLRDTLRADYDKQKELYLEGEKALPAKKPKAFPSKKAKATKPDKKTAAMLKRADPLSQL